MKQFESVDVAAAYRRISNKIRKTPIFEITLEGKPVVLKLEHLQVSGSFKYRGALNAVASLPAEINGVIAASGGNHGIAVALAARDANIKATVVVPEISPIDKRQRIEQSGAELIVHGREYAEAEKHARSLIQGNTKFIHPFADRNVISGQGTIGVELLEQLANSCDAVVASVGGGGLIAGVAVALASTSVKVIGVEPSGIPTLHSAIAAKSAVDVDVNSITAPSLGAKRTGSLNLSIAQEFVETVELVDDELILRAQNLLWNDYRLAVEPGAAVGFAGVLGGQVKAEKPCVIICGANSGFTQT